ERKRLPLDRIEVGRKFQVGDHEGYIHVGLYDDGSPGDIFVDIAKDGTTMAGLMNSLCLAVSMGLQYGVPPEVYVSKLSHMRFEPSGLTNDADIRMAKSIVDYIFRWFGKRFLTPEQQEEAGILSPEVKARMAERYAAGGGANGEAAAPAEPTEAPPPGQTALFNSWEDAAECARCGGRIIRTGSCYFAGTSVKVKGNVALNSNGSFSVNTADLNNLLELTCQLRAVPAGTTPADLTPFSGPVVGVGERESSKISGGANNGKAYDYAL